LVALLLAACLAGIVLIIQYSRDKEEADLAPQVLSNNDAAAKPSTATQQSAGEQLFLRNCAPCHGATGEGNGPAARYLYPRPRDFSENLFRIVSTENGKPSDRDLFGVITRGMPGSAMIPFGHLSEADRKSLVAYVRDLTKSSLIARVKRQSDEEVDPAEVDKALKPGAELEIPGQFVPTSPESVARGRTSYLKACAGCHGDQGKGDGVQEQKNSDGMPTRPRDLTRGIFKGGREPAQLYARIMLGLPGSPMPSSKLAVEPAEIGHLINYVNSLSDPALGAKVEHRRTRLVAKRVSQPLAAETSEGAWQSAAPVAIVVSPLWWRDYLPPDLQVGALHDGKTLALRLTWLDLTCNDSVTRPDDFEDMAAVQLFKGAPEPFLGMGSESSQVDLWLWRARWHGHAATAGTGQLDDYPFESPIYRNLSKSKNKLDFFTARAAGNLNANLDHSLSASNLTAKGFGSTTFRLKPSQMVTADATWDKGRWTVTLRRPLTVGAEDGISLAPGDEASVAFAIWDGAARDRNGQKLFSIWHDLKLDE
jgi:mono/diheme cytochrome c family protein